MQPTLALSASHPGILYINGRFAGEIGNDVPLIRPVGTRGAVYLEYHPLTGAYRSMARKLVFSGGMPMEESAEDAENLNIILWPGGVVEIELSCEAVHPSLQHFQLGGHNFILDNENLRLTCDGRYICTLPEGAELPQLHTSSSSAMLTGSCTGGKYMLSMDLSFQNQTGFLQANQLELESDGCIRAVVSSSDLVGHAMLETWKLMREGLTLISSEPAWSSGAPRWPKTPEETMRAAVEAALAGLNAEAERYLSPSLQGRTPLANIRDRCDLCVEMKYAPPSARPCVGLLRLEGTRMGHVSPLYFRTIPSGGMQSPYLIDEMEFT